MMRVIVGGIRARDEHDVANGEDTVDEQEIGGCLTRAVDKRHPRERWHLRKRDELKRS
jgi:hypothetical protein